MQRIKPTTIIALDPHAAAFCAAVGERVGRGSGGRGGFTQFRALAADGEHIRLEELPASPSAGGFELGAGASSPPPRAAEFQAAFARDAEGIEADIAELLKQGQSFTERQSALRDQMEIADERMIYFVLSSHNPLACGVILDLVSLVHFLRGRRFADELFTMHAVVLLPELFKNPSPRDYATTYALFKKLDDAALNGVDAGLRQRVQPFDSCWLIDGRNAKAITLGTLDEKLDSYADAFAGFLAAEPERSGALPGTHASRGRPPAYSSFGFGELFLPTEVAMKRLGAALARDIIARAYTPDEETPTDNDARRLLLAVTKFTRSKRYVDALEGLERDQGALIWQPFKQPVEPRDTAALAYVTELQRRHAEYDHKELTRFREELSTRKEEVLKELTTLLDDEIDARANASPAGLYDSLSFLRTLTHPGVVLREDLLNEEPQNLFTERRVASAALDSRLGVAFDRQTTTALFEQARELRGALQSLRVSLRLASPTPTETRDERPDESHTPHSPPEAHDATAEPQATTAADAGDAPASGSESESREDAPPPSSPSGATPMPDGDPRRIAEEIEAAERQLSVIEAEYPRAADREDRAADRERRAAATRGEQEKAEVVARAEVEVITLGDKLREARFTLDELKRERQQYLQRLLVVYPSAFGLLFIGLPLLAALGDIGPARDVVAFVWENLWNFLLGLLVAAALYLGVVFLVLTRDINRRIREASDRVDALFNQFNAAAAHLLGARNDQLNFEYRLYAQKLRAETFQDLIVAARERAAALERTISELRRLGAEFAREHAEALPPTSITRRPLLTADDMDAYYRRAVGDAAADAGKFSGERVSRSRARQLPTPELRAGLEAYGRERFDALTKLSVEDVLLGRHDLLPQNAALSRLRELNDTAEPLLRLRDKDASADNFAERDVTLWASNEKREQILSLYHRISPRTTDLASDDDRSLRVLQRCLNFPSYFLGPISHYRSCYDRQPDKDAAEFPDIIPLDGEVKRAYEHILLALALDLLQKNAEGAYVLDGSGDPLGNDRAALAEKLANTYALQPVYAGLQTRVQSHTSDHAAVHEKLNALPASVALSEFERQLLRELTQRYHPLG